VLTLVLRGEVLVVVVVVNVAVVRVVVEVAVVGRRVGDVTANTEHPVGR